MITNKLLLSILVLTIPCAAVFAQPQKKKIEPPQKIEYEGDLLSYNPSWKNKEIYLEANLENNPQPEIIIGFVATYKPPVSAKKREDIEQSYLPQKKEIAILQNHAFYQVYHKGAGGRYELSKIFSGMDRLGEVKIIALGEKGPNAIALLSPGGENYLELEIYQWKDGGYRLLFNRGSSHGIEIDSRKNPVLIRIGEETFSWSPQDNTFVQHKE